MLVDEIIELVPHCLLRFLKYLRWALLGHGPYLGWGPYILNLLSCVTKPIAVPGSGNSFYATGLVQFTARTDRICHNYELGV